MSILKIDFYIKASMGIEFLIKKFIHNTKIITINFKGTK